METHEVHLSVETGKMHSDVSGACLMSARRNLKAAITNMKARLTKVQQQLPITFGIPLLSSYRAKLDIASRTECEGISTTSSPKIDHMFEDLKAKLERKLMPEPSHQQISENRFQQFDWFSFWRDSKEAIPLAEPMGNYASTHCFVDDHHAGINLLDIARHVFALFPTGQ